MQNSKRYWLRGISVGIIVYIVVAIFSAYIFLTGTITCNEFVTVGSNVKESVLCGPVIFLFAAPLSIISELIEDISSGTITHLGLYSGFILSVVIYFGILALLGHLYGKIINKNKV